MRINFETDSLIITAIKFYKTVRIYRISRLTLWNKETWHYNLRSSFSLLPCKTEKKSAKISRAYFILIPKKRKIANKDKWEVLQKYSLSELDLTPCRTGFKWQRFNGVQSFPLRWDLSSSFRDVNHAANISLFICISHYVKLHLMMPRNNIFFILIFIP